MRYLCANGAGDPATLHQAIWNYNHSEDYVQQVLAIAALLRRAPRQLDRAADTAVRSALAQLGTPYLWGGEGNGGFDCSGLVQAAYAAAGITLPRVAGDQYNAGPLVPSGTDLQPGDLVFFGTGTDHITHVGIYLGDSQMIDAPHTGAVVRVEPYRWGDYLGATRPALTIALALPSPDTKRVRETLPPASRDDRPLRVATQISGDPSEDQVAAAVETLKLLADPTRLRILWALLHGEHSVNELANHVDAQPAAVSQHLAKLRLARLVATRREGTKIFYAAENRHIERLVEQAIFHADHRLDGRAASNRARRRA